MNVPTIRTASEEDRDAIIKTIVVGFAADPVTRWFMGDAAGYLELMPHFVEAFGGGAIAKGTAFVAEGCKAAALWHAPGEGPDEEALGAFMTRLATSRPEFMEEGGAFFEQITAFHPTETHWYLPLIAADPVHHGQGLGAALMKHALERCDQDKLPAYLESSNPRNISLYERHGFEVIGQIQEGSSPVMTPMLRPARG